MPLAGLKGAAYSNKVHLRNRLLREYARTNKAARHIRGPERQALMDRLEEAYLKPRIWRWQFDHVLGTQDRRAFGLYKAAVKRRARILREQRHFTTARMLERHAAALIDVTPREAWCYWPGEWKQISRALRPHGSNPKPGVSMELYTIYQRIIKTHTEENT